MQQIVSEVCATGVGLHLDDFGTGYSSLAALHRFPVDALKIDRSFVASLADDGRQRRDRALDRRARSQPRADVIAEGIENVLRSCDGCARSGCEYGQGFLFSSPQRG